MKKILIPLFICTIAGCVQLTLDSSDFAWPIETVLNVDEEGFVSEDRYSFSTNVKELFIAETADSLSFKNTEVRMIRDVKGYYFITSNGFKNVYVFGVNSGKFELYNKISVSEFGLDLPALNQRKPNIEVLDGEKHVAYIDSEGIKGEEN
jgi:hypothetical protein